MTESNSVRAARLLDTLSDDDRLPLKQVADILGVSYPTISRYKDNNWIRTFRVGRRTFVTVRETKRFNRYGNYDPNSPESAPDELKPPKTKEELAAEPLPIINNEEGLDLTMLSLEQRNRLGCESLQPADDTEDNEL